MKKPCRYAVDNGGDVWECGCYGRIYCGEREFDMNPDGSINIVMCGRKDGESDGES